MPQKTNSLKLLSMLIITLYRLQRTINNTAVEDWSLDNIVCNSKPFGVRKVCVF
jgi:hypothetical protein